MKRLVPASRSEAPLTLAVESFGGPWQPDVTASTGDVWRILWRRKGLIASTAALLVAIAVAYGAVAPRLYTAASEILVDPRDRQVFVNDVNPSTVSPDGGITQVESQVQVIQSSSVLWRAIVATDLTHDPEFSGAGTLPWLIEMWHGTSNAPRSQADIDATTLRTLGRRVTVTRNEKVFVINVNVTANSAEKAARLANAIADAYLVDQADSKAQAAERASAALTARLDEQRKRVEALDNEIQAYRKSNNIVIANGKFVGDQTLVDFTAQLAAAQARTAGLRAKVDQLRQPNGSPASTPEAMQSPVIAHLRQEEGTLVQKQAEMESRLGAQYPAVVSVRAQLASVRQLLTVELNRIATTLQGDYARALIDEQLLSAEVERAKTDSVTVRQASVRLRELERDLEASRAVYATFLARARETSEAVGVDTTNARIISRASPPPQRSWPPLTLLIMGAIGGGIGLGSGLALMREYVTPTILSRDQMERTAGAPVIGILPGSALKRRRRSLRNATLGLNASPNAMAIVGFALRRLFDVDVASTLREKLDVDSTLREKIGVRSLLITSGAPDADVRREVCTLFAAAARMRGDRVLLVDADVASGKPAATAGLLDVLHGECSLGSLVDVTPSTGITFLGKGRDQRSAILGNRGWSGVMRMLSEARQYFDLVIIDGGAIAENLQVAPLLAAAAEVVLVGQLAKTTQNDVNRAADAATIMGRPVSAILLIDPMEQS